MKTPQLIERLKHNWTIKVMCFVVAFFIYLFYNISTLDTKTLSIPLEIKQEGEVLLTSLPTHFVRVTVRGKPEDIVQISEQDFSAFLDLNAYVEAGSFSIPVSLQVSKQATLFSPLEFSCKPERVTLNLDKKMLSYIPVSPSFTGDLQKGYELESFKIEPAYIEALGPEKIILAIKEFKTKEVSLENASASFVQSVDIINTNNFVSFDPNINFSVHVAIKKIFTTKDFRANLGYFSGLSENLFVEDAFPSYTLSLRGFINDIEDFSLDVNSLYVDLSEIDEAGVYELPLELNLPTDFEVLEFEPQSIVIELKEKQLAIED